MSGTPPFFVVGNDRSGTTMLRLVLDRSAEAAVPPESMFLIDTAAARRGGELADAAQAARLLERIWEHPRVEGWGLPEPPPAVPAGLSHVAAYRFAVEAPFRAYASLAGKSRWGDKTPAYLRHVDELLEIWPDARVIVLVRDGRDVALSIMGLPFGPNNVWAAARSWAAGIRRGQEAERRYPGQVLTLRYEDLASEPKREIERACAFLKLEFDEEMLAIERTDAAKLAKGQEGWFTHVWAGINTSGVGKWRRQLSPAQQAVFSAVASDELRALGYETAAGAAPPVARAVAYGAHDAAMRAVNFVRLRVLEERGRELSYVLRRKLGRA
ncbi:MAG: sulfotransferase family protein [Gaiellaceae bacterium]